MAGGNPIGSGEQSDLSLKSFGHPADQEQHMHCDYGNQNAATYPPDVPQYWQTAYLLYYTDVDEDLAPTAVCSKKHYPERILVPAVYSPDARPALYENEVKVTAPAGSVLAYSMRTFHRGTRFKREGGTYRPIRHVCAGRTSPGRYRRLAGAGCLRLVPAGGSKRRHWMSVSFWASRAGPSLLDRGDPRRRRRTLSRNGHVTLQSGCPTKQHTAQ